MTATRTVTGHATLYTAPMPDGTSGKALLEQLIAAGAPGPAVGDGPATRVSIRGAAEGWTVEISFPGDDSGAWQTAVDAALGGQP